MSTRYRWSILWTVFLRLVGPLSAQPQNAVEIHPVALTSIDVAPYSTNTQRFWVVNTGTQTNGFAVFANVCTPYDLYCEWSNTFLGTLAFNDSVPVDVKFTAGHAGTSGTISFDARVSTNQSIRASKTLTVNARQETHLEVAAFNPGSAEARDLCLTVAVASDAAYECGDLRLVHALPSVRARGTVRTPTLLYNSRFAHPFALVAATFSTPPHDLTSVTARLRVPRPGGDIVISQGFADALFTASKIQKFVLAFDASALPTGVYPYTVTTTFSLAGTPDSVSASEELIVVNWKTSPFGAGWWLAGYERIYAQSDGSLLWVGGDGSARHYTSAGSGVYKAPGIDRPDSITVDSAGNYVRHLRSRATVQFAPNGKHFATTDRLGLVTFFHHDQYGQMAHIDPAGFSSLRYDFAYSSFTGPLETVTAPAVGGVSRVVQRYVLADGRILQHTDPDNTVVQFGFGNAVPEHITSRINRLSRTQSFAFDAVGKLVTVRVPLNVTDTAVTTFCPAESRGYVSTGCSGGPLHPDSAVTVMDGPRPDADAVDVTRFRLDRFGAPKLIRDALGNQTQLFRGNRDFPGLVTRLVHANGWANDTFHDAKGLITKLVQYAPLGPDRDAVTEYTWDLKWERVTQITYPENNFVRFAYDSVTGNRVSQEDGRGQSSRVDFRYYSSGSADRLLRAAEYPTPSAGGDRDSLEYDAIGNLADLRQVSGNLVWTRRRFTNDAIGRTTSTCTDIDIAGNGGLQCQLRLYDVMGRDSVMTDSGPPGPPPRNQPAQAVRVRSFYDAEGNLKRIERLSFSNGVKTGIDTLKTLWDYDLADRRIREIAGDSRADSLVYDAAGNNTAFMSRRYDPANPGTRLVISMAYDALNRLTTRISPAVHYPLRNAGIPAAGYNGDSLSTATYPRLLRNASNGLTIAADTARFTYDEMGAIRTANNGDARATRTYYANGLVQAETLKVRNYSDSSFSNHVYTTGREYDLNGRRTALTYPTQLTTTAGGTFNRVRYQYSPTTGALESVTDLQNNVFTLLYDAQTRVDSIVLPGNIVRWFGYDGASRLIDDFVFNRDSTTLGHFTTTLLRATTVGYNSRGDRLRLVNDAGKRDSLLASYYGLGHLDTTYYSEQRSFAPEAGRSRSIEWFARDALANDTASATILFNLGSKPFEVTGGRKDARYQTGTGRQVRRFQYDEQLSLVRTDSLLYDESGNLAFSWTTFVWDRPATRDDRAMYYSADGQLRVVDHRTATVGTTVDVPMTFDFDEFRYDALGRRVLARTQRECTINVDAIVCGVSTIRRTVWDGSQEIAEIQQPGHTGTSDPVIENDTAFAAQLPVFEPGVLNADLNRFYGRVAYTFGPTLDQPLSVTRWAYQADSAGQVAQWLEPFSIVPHWNMRGEADNGAFADGSIEHCGSTISSRCLRVAWPYGWSAYQQKTFQTTAWHGSLLEQKRDGSGLLFKRNRYLDPATGKFTQEDPIGLAGGLNLYGFAGGDPVSFGDPFGLVAMVTDEWDDCNWKTGEGCSVEVRRLLRVDKPIEEAHPEDLVMLATGPGAVVRTGLRAASPALRALFAGGSIRGASIIGIRSQLLKAGFKQALTQNKKGYLFRNAAGEEVRVMSRGGGWDVRIRNAAGNYLDEFGDVGNPSTTHGISVFSR